MAGSASAAAGIPADWVLLVGWPPDGKEVQAFRQGLRDAGYAEERDIVFEWRSARGNYHNVAALAFDLVQKKVDVIVADVTVGTRAAKLATSTIPVVMTLVSDPSVRLAPLPLGFLRTTPHGLALNLGWWLS